MKVRIRKPHKIGFFALLLGLLGFGGCQLISPEMYGSPTALFSVKGKVTDEQGNPIQNLEVNLYGVDSYEGQDYVIPNYREPARTDKTGTFFIEMSDSPFTTVQVNVQDVDGAAQLTLKQHGFEGSGLTSMWIFFHCEYYAMLC